MKPLSEFAKEKTPRTFLIYGDAGSGKTCLASSFPGKIRYFDFDNKIGSAADFYSDSPELLSRIDVTQYREGKKGDKRIFQRFAADLNEFHERSSEYNTVVFDSLTTLADIIMSEEMKLRPGKAQRDSMAGVEVPNMKDYQVAISYTKDLIKKILSIDCANIVVTAHIMTSKDEASGIISSTLQIWGKDLPSWIPKMFQEVYRLHIKDGKRIAQTEGDRKFTARSQVRKIPALLDITNGYKEIQKCLD